MTGLIYFKIVNDTNRDTGMPLSKDKVMEEINFWSIGTCGVEHWGFPLEINIMHKMKNITKTLVIYNNLKEEIKRIDITALNWLQIPLRINNVMQNSLHASTWKILIEPNEL